MEFKVVSTDEVFLEYSHIYLITVLSQLGFEIHKSLLFASGTPSGWIWGRESAVRVSSPFCSELYFYSYFFIHICLCVKELKAVTRNKNSGYVEVRGNGVDLDKMDIYFYYIYLIGMY